MAEQESQFISKELSSDIKSSDIEVKNKPEKEGMTVEEVNDKLDELTRNVYLKLLSEIDSAKEKGSISKEKYEELIKRIDGLSEKELGYKISEKYISPEKAEEILGNDFLGPKDIEKVFGIEVKDVPPIPFSIEDISRAKELGQFLIFRTNEIPEDKMKLLNVKQTLEKAPEKKWALISKKFIPNLQYENFLEQNELIIDYLKNNVFSGLPIPKEYKKAIKEFEFQKEELKELIKSDNKFEFIKEGMKRASNLKIIKLTRRTLEELFYDLEVYYQKNNLSLLLYPLHELTASRLTNGDFVMSSSFFDKSGVSTIHHFSPTLTYHKRYGVCFSRTI